MKRYKRYHRSGSICLGVLVTLASILLVTRVNLDSLGSRIQLAVAASALILSCLAAVRDSPGVKGDCSALVAAGASFAIAFGLVDGPVRVLIGASVVLCVLASTVVLFLMAEVTSSRSPTRLS